VLVLERAAVDLRRVGGQHDLDSLQMVASTCQLVARQAFLLLLLSAYLAGDRLEQLLGFHAFRDEALEHRVA
jgi:hypothetical protein